MKKMRVVQSGGSYLINKRIFLFETNEIKKEKRDFVGRHDVSLAKLLRRRVTSQVKHWLTGGRLRPVRIELIRIVD